MSRLSPVAAAALLLTGCGGIPTLRETQDLAWLAADRVVLVDGWHLLTSAETSDPDQLPAITYVDLTTPQTQRTPVELAPTDTLQHTVAVPDGRYAVCTARGQVRVYDADDALLHEQWLLADAHDVSKPSPGVTQVKPRVIVSDLAWIPGQEALLVAYAGHPTCGDAHDEACGARLARLELGGEATVRRIPRSPHGVDVPAGGRVACSADGALALTFHGHGQLEAWRADTLEPAWSLDCSGWAMPRVHHLGVAISPGGEVVVVAGDGHLACYALTDRALRWETDGGPCVTLTFTPDAQTLVVCEERIDGTRVRGRIRLLDPASGVQTGAHDVSRAPGAMALSADGRRVVVAHGFELEVVDLP